MVDLMAKASALVASRLRSHLSRPVEYRRGGETIDLNATIGKTIFEVDSEVGFMRVESRDFIVQADELRLSGALTVPRRGDLVIECTGSGDVIHEVVAPPGTPEWRWSDVDRRTVRIHTKQVSAP